MRLLAFLLFLLFCAFALVARWYYICEIKQLCGEEDIAIADQRAATLRVSESGALVMSGFDQFAFEPGSVQPLLNDNNRLFLDTITYYLNQYPAKNLVVSGHYRHSERESSHGFFENLGLGRAAGIRDMLVERGIETSRIMLDFGESEDDRLSAPLRFETYIPEGEEEFVRMPYLFADMAFSAANFHTETQAFLPGQPLRIYADSLRSYLNSHPSRNLVIVAHTDKIGEDAVNASLGLQRANNVKKYFEEKLAVDGKRIQTRTEGEKQPTATNTTHEGRQKNRRINFVLQ